MSDSEGAWSCSNNDADGSCDSRDGALCILSSLEWLQQLLTTIACLLKPNPSRKVSFDISPSSGSVY